MGYFARVTPLSHGRNSLDNDRFQLSHRDDNDHASTEVAGPWPYGLPVRDSSTGRKQAFAAFVRKALEDARTVRAWTGSEVARRTGVSRQTIHRWRQGDWSTDPEPERVVAFCEGLGINVTIAFGILGWDRSASARPPAAPPPMDPDIEALLRRLMDPSTPEAEKYHIRETVRYLAYRPRVAAEQPKRRRRAG